MDKGEYENELKQVIGDTRAYDISEHDTLVFGSYVARMGPNSRHHEPIMCLPPVHHHRHLHAELLRAALDSER